MEWRPVPGYEALYEVSAAGEVRNVRTQRVLRPDVGNNGYPAVRLSRDGVKRHLTVHPLTAEAFCGPRLPGAQVRHLNGNELDGRAENLTWGTAKQNAADRKIHGTQYQLLITHCPADHPYDAENTRVYQGRRYCKECNRRRSRERQRRKRLAAKEQP